MEKYAFLLEGYTPVMLFIFICFAALLVIFYRTMRGLDELVKSKRRGGKPAADDTMGVLAMRMEELVRMQAESLVVLKSLAGMSLDGGARKEAAPYRIPEEEVESIDYALGGEDMTPKRGEEDLDESMVMQASRAVAGTRGRDREPEAVTFDDQDEAPFAGMEDDDLDLSSDDLDMSDDLDLTTDMSLMGDDVPVMEPEPATAEFPPAETVAEVPAAPAGADEDDEDLDLDLGLFDQPEDDDEAQTLVLESGGDELEEAEDEDDALAMLGGMDDTAESSTPPESIDMNDQETMFADLGGELEGMEDMEPEAPAPPMGEDEDEDDDLHMDVAEDEDEDEPEQDEAFMEEAGETLRSMEDDLLGAGALEEGEDESFEAKAAKSLNLTVDAAPAEPEPSAAPEPPAAPEVEDDIADDLDLDLSAGLDDMDLGGMDDMDLAAMEEDEPVGLEADTEDEPDLDSTMALDDLVDRLEMTSSGETDDSLSVEDDLAAPEDIPAGDLSADDLGADDLGMDDDFSLDQEPEAGEPPSAPEADSMDGDTLEGHAIDFSDLDEDAMEDTLFIRKTPEERDAIAGLTAGDLEDDLSSGALGGDDLEDDLGEAALSSDDMEDDIAAPAMADEELEAPELEMPDMEMSDIDVADVDVPDEEGLGDTSIEGEDQELGDTALDDESLGIDLDEDSLGLTLSEEEFGDLSVEDDLGDLGIDEGLDGLSVGDDLGELSLEAGDIDVPDEPPLDEDDDDIDIRVGGLDDGISDDTATFDLDDLTGGLDDVQVEIMSGVADEDISFDDVDEGMSAPSADDDLSMTMNLSDDDLLDLTMDDISDDNAGDTLLLLDENRPKAQGGKAPDGSENIVDYIIEE